MKKNAIVSLALSILEGGLAGAYFYLAEQQEERTPRALWHIVSALWFVLSVLDGMEGARSLREAGGEKGPGAEL